MREPQRDSVNKLTVPLPNVFGDLNTRGAVSGAPALGLLAVLLPR